MTRCVPAVSTAESSGTRSSSLVPAENFNSDIGMRLEARHPRMEEGLLNAIKAAAIYGSAALEHRQTDEIKYCNVLDELQSKVQELGVDPDENPKFLKNIAFAIQHLQTFDLDAMFIVTNSPGCSAFNRVELRIAPLSKQLMGVVLPHETHGLHFEPMEKMQWLDEVEVPTDVPDEVSSNITADELPIVSNRAEGLPTHLVRTINDLNQLLMFLIISILIVPYFAQIAATSALSEPAATGSGRDSLHFDFSTCPA
ncbi:hypothetical protein EVAR_76815_1 [Eumeta japonica]|uniref:Uncharacterized protein n=1 Tax=Eumeta variegata TaxID=151549 RepID=A0A4C1STX1_EUMVA|nr:hypothetical protein EVAR_76815_1 [Eumeta japonica]